MPVSMKRRRFAVTAAATLTGLIAAGIAGAGWLAHRPPEEVRTLDAVLRRLAQANDLGQQPLAFMVGSGSYTAYLAGQRGLCKPEQCDLFAQLNPYRHYGNGWDELIRQGYALGDIQGWSASSGTVVIPRAAFRAYGPRLGYLACTVAHEIAHIRSHHIFQQSYHLHHNLHGQNEKAKKLGELKRSRELELEADREAATMLARAAYPARICQHELEFMARSIGDGSISEPESTHPGYEERLAALRAHYDAMEQQPPAAEPSTRISTSYSRSDNLLTLTPQPR
jgi:Zn-dependent protease with chaperone function